ncbi:JAB domain-containing protein similar to deubiquitination enzymes [Comamonas sp. 26]|nr:ThiF family adenylyltransferase [Comamonas sp. 26]PIG08294.1 JAB domain-containing protein similar to deubiquitination enzymes [Comamonas sp. 26]
MIKDALDQLRQHRGIARVGAPSESDGLVQVEVDIPVELPSRAIALGVSATGVRAVETCTLVFRNWPMQSPRVLLRPDFPRNLPHINPGAAGTPVNPCIFEGSIDELLHRLGLDAVIDQIIDWLTKAAGGYLIDPAQGWEPTRRDSCPSIIVASADKLIAVTPLTGEIYESGAGYVCIEDGIYAYLDEGILSAPGLKFSQETKTVGKQQTQAGICPVLAVRAPVRVDGAHVVSTYHPESVVDLPSLLERARLAGVDSEALNQKLAQVYQDSVWASDANPRTWSAGLYVIVILLVERPTHLIGAPERRIEVLPYVVRFNVNPSDLFQREATAHPAFHSHSLTSQLLAQASGKSAKDLSKKIVFLGAGSLGSKLALHLGRAGFGSLALVDNDRMSPHNLARHALLRYSPAIDGNKAEMMREALAALSHYEVKSSSDNAVMLLKSEARFSEVVEGDVAFLIDSTASLQVLAALATSEPLDQHGVRVVRAQLYSFGRCAVLTREGKGRTTRADDLNALAFEIARGTPSVRSAITGGESNLARLFVGDNCSSLTMPMPDSVISRAASSMSIQIEHWLSEGCSDDGELCIGIEDASGLGLLWSKCTVSPTTVIPRKDRTGWEVRVLHHVASAIDADARKWGALETGGALVGRVNNETRTVTVTGLIAPPPDSTRSPVEFTLGTEGLAQALRQAHSDSAGHLMFVGTWHSHPMGGGHSGIDRQTLRKIAEIGNGLPMLSLVWTPHGFICEVEKV